MTTEDKARRVEEIIEAKGIEWDFDLADAVRNACAVADVKDSPRKIAARVLADLKGKA